MNESIFVRGVVRNPSFLRNGRINGYVADIIYDLLHVPTLF